MKCKNCGAVYKTVELKCPYCNTENIVGRLWKVQKSEAEKEYVQKSIKTGLKFSPYIIDRVLTRANMIVIAMYVLFFIGVVAYFFMHQVLQDWSNKINKDSIMGTLQEYYDNEEYAKLYEYINDKELYDGYLDDDYYYKYMQAALLNKDYESHKSFMMEYLDLSDEKRKEDDFYLEYSIINSLDVYTLDCGVYSELVPENKELYEKYKKEIYAFWVGTLGMTEKDIEYITDEYVDFYDDTFDEMVNRFKENIGEVYGSKTK